MESVSSNEKKPSLTTIALEENEIPDFYIPVHMDGWEENPSFYNNSIYDWKLCNREIKYLIVFAKCSLYIIENLKRKKQLSCRFSSAYMAKSYFYLYNSSLDPLYYKNLNFKCIGDRFGKFFYATFLHRYHPITYMNKVYVLPMNHRFEYQAHVPDAHTFWNTYLSFLRLRYEENIRGGSNKIEDISRLLMENDVDEEDRDGKEEGSSTEDAIVSELD